MVETCQVRNLKRLSCAGWLLPLLMRYMRNRPSLTQNPCPKLSFTVCEPLKPYELWVASLHLRPNIPEKVQAALATASEKPVHAAKQRLLAQEKRALAKAKAAQKPKGKANKKAKPKPKTNKPKKAKAKGKSVKKKPASKPGTKRAATNWMLRKKSFIEKAKARDEGIKTRKDEEAAWRASDARVAVLASMSRREIKRRRYD